MNVNSRPDPHVLLVDLAFPESPRWRDGRLWVSDWGANEVIAVDPVGRSEVVARVESFPMCIDHLPDGRLLIVSSADRRLLRQEPDDLSHSFIKLQAAEKGGLWHQVLPQATTPVMGVGR